MKNQIKNFKYLTIKQVLADDKYPFSEGKLQLFLSHRYTNGLNKSILKIGRGLYIRSDLFDEWIEGHRDLQKIRITKEK